MLTVDAGTNAQLPCVSISTAVIIDSHITPEGQMQHRLAVPRLALATALIELPPDIRSMVSRLDGGVLLGALGFQATLTLPITPGCVPPGALQNMPCVNTLFNYICHQHTKLPAISSHVKASFEGFVSLQQLAFCKEACVQTLSLILTRSTN